MGDNDLKYEDFKKYNTLLDKINFTNTDIKNKFFTILDFLGNKVKEYPESENYKKQYNFYDSFAKQFNLHRNKVLQVSKDALLLANLVDGAISKYNGMIHIDTKYYVNNLNMNLDLLYKERENEKLQIDYINKVIKGLSKHLTLKQYSTDVQDIGVVISIPIKEFKTKFNANTLSNNVEDGHNIIYNMISYLPNVENGDNQTLMLLSIGFNLNLVYSDYQILLNKPNTHKINDYD